MYQTNLFDELIIDNFAGGGGASVGIELAVGRPVDIAINHNPDAIAMHAVNHPYTHHYQEDVFAIDPIKVTDGKPVGIAWFSPDCRHFSKAKGNKPVERKIRGLSWVILKWAMCEVAPRVIFMENVEEIQTWGPLMKDPKDPEKLIPDPDRAGETFKGFVAMLTTGIDRWHPAFYEACEFLKLDPYGEEAQKLVDGLGYEVDYRALRACDYGAPTIRKRFVLIARRDGQSIVWPKPTHGKGKGLKPYRTAADCIDWSLPCPSIFTRKKPLVENTLRRVARGLDKFVIKNPKPYILEMNYNNQFQDVDKPMSTQTSANHHYLITPNLVQANYENPPQDVSNPMSTQTAVNKHFVVTPTLVECSHKSGPGVHNVVDPLNTVTGKACFGLSTPYLTKFQQHSLGQSTDEPLDTVMAGATRFGAVTPYMIPIGYGENKSQAPRLEDIHKPLNTIVSSNKHFVTAPFLSKYFSGDGNMAAGAGEPTPTITAKDHNSLVAANIVHYYGGENHASGADSPVATVTVEPRHYLCKCDHRDHHDPGQCTDQNGL